VKQLFEALWWIASFQWKFSHRHYAKLYGRRSHFPEDLHQSSAIDAMNRY